MTQQDIINSQDNFISAYKIDEILCDEIIYFFQNCKQKNKGMIFANGELKVHENIKKSTDVYLSENFDLQNKYIAELQKKAVLPYIEKYPCCNAYASWQIIDYIGIQYYKPNEGFYRWHTERVCGKGLSGSRHLVFITYLNDVTDEGETEFFHQKLKVKPEKGLTIIFPADWTFTHRGIPSKTQEKYIVTGWFNFTD